MPQDYKKRINDFIDNMVKEGADQDQILTALTRCTINFMRRVRERRHWPDE